jgi:hypothetical protein
MLLNHIFFLKHLYKKLVCLQTDIFQMHEEYKLYGPLNNFCYRYYSLNDKTRKDLAKTNFDSAAIAHDCLIHPMGLETSKGCEYLQ